MDDNAVNYALLTSGIYGPNPYLTNQGRIPASTYRGAPTDAMGNPIQPPPGTTLNTPAPAPAAAPPAPTGVNPFSILPGNTAIDAGNRAAGLLAMSSLMRGGYGGVGDPNSFTPGPGTPGMTRDNPAGVWSYMNPAARQQQQAAPAAPPDTSYQTALDLLSNPGKIETRGATVPQSQPVSSQPSVLDQFLATQRGGMGAGGYSNTGFFDTLNRLRGNPLTGAGQAQGTSLAPNVRDMGGMAMGDLPGRPPAGAPGAPKDIATRGYLDASGRPTGPLMAAARQNFGNAQQRLAPADLPSGITRGGLFNSGLFNANGRQIADLARYGGGDTGAGGGM